MSELDARVWRDHERWLTRHARAVIERERWGGHEWAEVRRVADAAWNVHRSNLYLYDAERALREYHYRRVEARLAAEAEHGVEWLLGVIGGRDAA